MSFMLAGGKPDTDGPARAAYEKHCELGQGRKRHWDLISEHLRDYWRAIAAAARSA